MNVNDERYISENTGKKSTVVLMSILLLVILTVAVFANTVGGKFLLDDPVFIAENAYVKNLAFLPKLFSSTMGAGSGSDFNYYRPLQMSAYAIIYNFWQLNVVPYHVLNILLHVLTVLSLYWMVNLLFENKALSLFTAMLYAVHPIQSETVAYISDTGDCLVGLFMLLSFIFYVKQLKKGTPGTYILFFASLLLALFSKENSLILPALFLLYHAAFKRRIKIYPFILACAMVAGYLAFRVSVGTGPETTGMALSDIFRRIPGFFGAIAGYMKILLLPFGLNMGYDSRYFKFADPLVVTGMIVSALLLSLAIKKFRDNPLVSFAIFWFFITLLPVSNLYAVAFYMADHYLYLPAIGFFLIVGKGFDSAYANKKLRVYAIAGVTLLTAFYSFLTFNQNLYWKDPATFFERTLKYNPYSFRALNNLGRQYEAAGRLAEAKNLYEGAVRANPHKQAYNNLGNIYAKMGNNEKAAEMYKKALEFGPYAKGLHNLADVYAKSGRSEEAEEMYNKALEANPYLLEAYCGLGMLYQAIGRSEEAISSYEKAIEKDPHFAGAYTGLGNVYAGLGEYEKATAIYSKAIEEDPKDANAYNNIGNIKSILGEKEEAMVFYRKAVELKPDFVGAHYNIARLNVELGKTDEAIEAYKSVIEIAPGLGPVYHDLSLLYYDKGQYDLAIKYCDLATSHGYSVPPETHKKLRSYRE